MSSTLDLLGIIKALPLGTPITLILKIGETEEEEAAEEPCTDNPLDLIEDFRLGASGGGSVAGVSTNAILAENPAQ